MSKKYNPYPVNNERCGTFQYEDALDYEYTFYHNRKFHEDRLERGKKMVKAAKTKSILLTALTGVCAYGAMVHGIGAFTGGTVSNLFVNITATSLAIGTGFAIVKEGILPGLMFISNAKKDMEVSKTMVKRLTK